MSFVPSSTLTPGRLNFFHFKNYSILADFAHNPHGLKLLGDFVNKLEYPKKIGVISGTGDRRDEDIMELGELSAQYFDEIIIRCDKNLRGRTADEIIDLLQKGIQKADPNKPTKVIANENEALEHIYANPQAGALYVVMCDVVAGALEKIRELKERERSEEQK
jgi:cyanophycin synthetase